MKLTKLPTQHSDSRGFIRDIFGKDSPDAVTFIQTNAGCVRGNHVHDHTTQHVYMLSGMMWAYGSKRIAGAQKPEYEAVERVELRPGNLLEHPPSEAHAYEAITDCTFLAFADGVRKGTSYEDDTIRVASLIERWQHEQPGAGG